MTQNIVQLKNVAKTYRQNKKAIPALDNFSLEVPAGSFVSVMGPSGCGKSTVTKIIAGIEPLDSGTLLIDGENYSAGVPKSVKERTGYVFQWHNLAEWRTVEGNLYLPLELYGQKKSPVWAERAEKYLDLVGLYQYRAVYPHELSGGMKQRVGLARALMNEPDILIFDQPFGALDAITRAMLSHSFSAAMRKEGKTMLMVTSNVEEAIRYSDYIYIMTKGPGRNKSMIKTDITPEQRDWKDFWLHDEFLVLKKEIIDIIYDIEPAAAQEG